jgi:DNA-binding beta-propeller fold protein YncE
MNSRLVGSNTLLVAAAVLLGCSDSSASLPPGESVFVATFLGNEMPVVTGGGVSQRIGPIPSMGAASSSMGAARSLDSTRLYVLASDGVEHFNALIAVDTRTRRILWSDSVVWTPSRQTNPDAVLFSNAGGIAVSPDGKQLIWGRAFRHDTLGVGAVDLATRRAFMFQPLLAAADVAMLPPGLAASAGAVLILAHRTLPDWNGPAQVYIADPGTLALVDSVLLTPIAGPDDALMQVVPGANGQTAYVLTVSMLYKLDLVTRTTVAAQAHPFVGTHASLAVATDGQRLYLPDAGDELDSPGSGLVYAYGSDLEPLDPFDLRASASVDGAPPTMHGAAVSVDGERLYVATGSAAVGPTFGSQPGRLLVLDASRGVLLRAIDLGVWLPVDLLVTPY